MWLNLRTNPNVYERSGNLILHRLPKHRILAVSGEEHNSFMYTERLKEQKRSKFGDPYTYMQHKKRWDCRGRMRRYLTYPLEIECKKTFEETPHCAVCEDENPYIKYKYCQRDDDSPTPSSPFLTTQVFSPHSIQKRISYIFIEVGDGDEASVP